MTPVPRTSHDVTSFLLLGGGTAAAVSAVLPWASLLWVSISGTSADWGYATLTAGTLAVVTGALRWGGRGGRRLLAGALVGGLVTTTIAGVVLLHDQEPIVESRIDSSLERLGLTADDVLASEPSHVLHAIDESLRAEVEPGLWMTLGGGAAMTLGAVVGMRRLRRSAVPQVSLSGPRDGEPMTSTSTDPAARVAS